MVQWFLTRDGKLNSFRKPKSSPVAKSFRSLLSDAAFTELSDGQIPSQVGPTTDVQVAQSSFSNWTGEKITGSGGNRKWRTITGS